LLYLWSAIKKFKIKIVLVGHILPLGTVTYWLSKILKFEYIVFIHGMELGIISKSKRKTAISKKILANAKKVIAANGYTKQLLTELVSENKIKVVNPGVELRTTHNAQRTTQLKEKYNLQNKKVLLQVGRLVERKGVDKVLEAMPAVLEKCPDLVYVVIGDGFAKKNLQLKTYNLKLQDNVIFIPNASDDEVDYWYKISNSFIMPSRNIDGDFEGFGIVYLEANAHGKPVIAGDSGGVRDAVQDGVNGLLVNPESVDEISKAIVKLCKDDELRIKLGQQGKEWVKNFEWSGQVEKIKNNI